MSMKPKMSKGGCKPSAEVGVATKKYKSGGQSQRTSKRRVVDK